jgi:hypothetical protein
MFEFDGEIMTLKQIETIKDAIHAKYPDYARGNKYNFSAHHPHSEYV